MKISQKLSCFIMLTLCCSISIAEEFGIVQLAKSNISLDETGSPDFDAGMSLILNANRSIGGIDGFFIEGEFSKSITALSYSKSTNVNDAVIKLNTEISYWSLGAYGAYVYPVSTKIEIRGRLGFVYMSSTGKSNDTCSGSASICDIAEDLLSNDSSTDTGTGMAFGGSVSYAYTDNMRVILEYTKINTKYDNGEVSTTHIGVGAYLPF